MYVTATKLYDYLQCEYRVWRDVNGPKEEKIKEPNPFVEMLWDKGVQHEENIIAQIGEFVDVSDGSLDDRYLKTIELLKNKTPLIYQGVLKYKNLLGIPDLLRLQSDGTYIPIEIKSGAGYEGVDEESDKEGKLKKTYAVQLALYVELLELLGFEHKNKGAVIDIHGAEVEYNMDATLGIRDKRTYWEFYHQVKSNVELLINNEVENKPALAGICKLCPWYTSCKKWVHTNEDLSEIYYLGRSKRDVINEDLGIVKISDFKDMDVSEAIKTKVRDKTYLKGIAEKTLTKLVRRAKILQDTKEPVSYEKIDLPNVTYELFFDIEDDPTQEFVYMHGVYERKGKDERFIHFTAMEINADAEKKAWSDFWEYIKSLPQDDFAVYYYSAHEKTTYRRLQKQYPDVITHAELEAFFDNPNVIDLYGIVAKYTDWPVSSYSLKELATYSGFSWRDETPSGALSIQWFNEYIEKRDKKILERILEYNEDDCRATMILKDKLSELVIIENNY